MEESVVHVPFTFILCLCFFHGGQNVVEIGLFLNESKLPVFDLLFPVKLLVARKRFCVDAC
jgi:hypothetical protein